MVGGMTSCWELKSGQAQAHVARTLFVTVIKSPVHSASAGPCIRRCSLPICTPWATTARGFPHSRV